MHPSRKGIEFKAILFFKLDKKRQVGYNRLSFEIRIPLYCIVA